MRTKRERYVTYKVQAKKKPYLEMRFVARWLVPACILIVTAVVYVWEKNSIISLGYEINATRKEISAAEGEEQTLQARLVELQTAKRLMDEVEKRQLGLEEVSPNRWMTLVSPPPIRLSLAKRKPNEFPPAASRPLAKAPVAAPHRENSVLKQRR